jgi:hypothetical protein
VNAAGPVDGCGAESVASLAGPTDPSVPDLAGGFVQPTDPAVHGLAARLAELTDPAVRDLAWLLFSADLLLAQPPRASLAVPWADAAEAEAVVQWLLLLDRDPAPLHAVLAGSAATRLGRYAEILLGWFLSCGPAGRLVAANVPLRRAGRTLGECDFLVAASDGRRLHWELAVKCYLHAGGPQATLADFVGPNLRDRLDLKHAHLLDHQLRLTEREEFASLGYPGPWGAEMFVKGWLFYGAGASAQATVQLCDPPAVAPGHARGWWVRRSEWAAFAGAALAGEQAAHGWSVLPRLAWLAPRRLAAGAVSTVAAPVDAATLFAQLPREDEPVMVAAFVAESGSGVDEVSGASGVNAVSGANGSNDSNDTSRTVAKTPSDGSRASGSSGSAGGAVSAHGYIERSRGFIVPDDWPERAQAFARESRK